MMLSPPYHEDSRRPGSGPSRPVTLGLMRDHWKTGLAVLAAATTFTVGASAGLLKQPAVDERPAAAPAPDPPPFVVTDVAARPARLPPQELDTSDPWTAAPKPLATRRAPKAKPKPRSLDTTDPWTTSATDPAPAPPTP